ncbi:DUF6538 domain-containing protein [Hyphomonas sp.]|uniref:DUF6538 domain-containing protein n=1 Tax=Hyphomonas sp. TaxID=87 RepID=UPI0025B99913|nr:DUF6538 domain-containing protein [Hyphomonas sp.]
MREEDRYLQKRGRKWHYVRRVPTRLRHLDGRHTIRVTLRTNSLEIARERRNAQEAVDDQYWATLLDLYARPEIVDTRKLEFAERRYKAARARASARGLSYIPADELAITYGLDDIIERIRAFEQVDKGDTTPRVKTEAEGLLGGAPRPSPKLSEVFEIYCEKIAFSELLAKSANQKRLWLKTKQRPIGYFIEVVGDKPVTKITRDDALKFYHWWGERLKPKKGGKALQANTANRDIGNLRKLLTEYFKHIGEESRQNPFRNLSFKETVKAEVPPFETDWVRQKILVPDALKGIKDQARLIVYALIETGCRPSEIANLREDDICLDTDAPYIRIRPRRGREIKTNASIRDIPLVGVSLEAMKRAPKGFPHYRDRSDLLSQSLMTTFRNRGLFPTENHVIYSFRHSFEKRMLEAGLDYGLRCLLMGHATSRPAYGDGGSMAYRRDELLKIAHPVPEGLFG